MELIPSSISEYTLESYLVKITSRSRIIYWIFIGTTVIGITLLPFIYVDVSVQARGYFQPDMENQIVYSPFQGKVIFSSIRNGLQVKKGDTLFIIDSENTRAQLTSLKQRIIENEEFISDLEKVTRMDSITQFDNGLLVTKRYQAEFANLEIKHKIQFQKYQKIKNEHERNDFLYALKIIPTIDYENSLFLLSSEEENLSQLLLSQKSIWHSDLAYRVDEKIQLQADLEQCIAELNNRIILAPIDGAVIQSSDFQVGSIVSSGQRIAELTPEGELLATFFVMPSDIGFIHENQHVKIQVDAFNYTEWGTLDGKIIDISDDLIFDNNTEAYFRIKCKPSNTYLSLKNGYQASVKKGMSLNARIVILRRSLFKLLFDKTDKWLNPYSYAKD